MSANNQVIIIGRVGNDVGEEMKYLPSGVPKAEVRVAVSRPVKDESGNQTTDWISCEFWSKQAEIMGEYVKKGDLISVSGSLRVDQWEGTGGEKRKRYYVRGENFQMLESKAKSQERRASENPSYRSQETHKSEKKLDDFEDAVALDEDELPPF